MKIVPLNPAELERLDKLSKSSADSEFSWVKARMRFLSNEIRQLTENMGNLEARLEIASKKLKMTNTFK